MAKIPVYCTHNIWASFGPGTFRCIVCKVIWKKFKDPKEPETIIGYSKSRGKDRRNGKRKTRSTNGPKKDL